MSPFSKSYFIIPIFFLCSPSKWFLPLIKQMNLYFSLSFFNAQKKHSQMPLPSGLSNEKKDILARIAFSKTVILKLFYVFGQQPAVVSRYKVT